MVFKYILEVLVRLPDCKSAIQCVSLVSKHWYSLTSNPFFIRSFNVHHHQQQLPFTIFILSHNYPIPLSIYSIQSHHNILFPGRPPFLPSSNSFKFLPPIKNSNPWVVKASCNDLLLVSSYDAAASKDDQLYICNPLTKKYVALPNPNLNVDSQLFNCKYGLLITNNYKVLLKTGYSYTLIATIYCSITLKWCSVMLKSPQKLHFYPKILFNSNGMLHWIDVRSPYYGRSFVFDPKRKDLYYINGPIGTCFPYYRMNDVFIGVCQGQLRMSLLKREFGKKLLFNYSLQVWELGNYDNNDDSWCLKHEVQFEMDSTNVGF